MDEKAIGDMYLAAAFLSYKIPLIRIEKPHSRRQSFIFSGCPERIYIMEAGVAVAIERPTLDMIECKFVGETLMFPPSYPDAVRRIKSSIHSGEIE